MAVDGCSPHLLAYVPNTDTSMYARKRKFLSLIQALCNEFDSLHALTRQGTVSSTSDRQTEDKEWSLPLSLSGLSGCHGGPDYSSSPSERLWGVAGGRPPSTQLHSISPASPQDIDNKDTEPESPLPAMLSFTAAVSGGGTHKEDTECTVPQNGKMEPATYLSEESRAIITEAVPIAPVGDKQGTGTDSQNTHLSTIAESASAGTFMDELKNVTNDAMREEVNRKSSIDSKMQFEEMKNGNVQLGEHWSSAHMAAIYKRSGFLTGRWAPNRATEFVETSNFKYATAALIVTNSMFVGIEMNVAITQALADGSKDTHALIHLGNALYTFLFTVELAIRIFAYRVYFFLGPDWAWNTFDSAIVGFALAEYAFSAFGGLSALRVMRGLRLAKTLRIIRVVTIFRHLQLIVQGLLNSLLSLVWMIFLLFLAVYLTSILFIGGAFAYLTDDALHIAEEEALKGDTMSYLEMRAAFQRDFCSIGRGMFTMFLSVTGGVDWYAVVQPLLNVSVLYAFIFIVYIIFVVFGVFNVLNAVFVESVLTNRDKDLLIQTEQAKTRMFMKDLAELFREGDKNNDGHFSKDELAEHCRNPRFCAYLATHALDSSDAEVLFEILDQDRSGAVDVEEFVLGAMKLKGPARCLDMLKVLSNFKALQLQVEKLTDNVRRTSMLTMSMQNISSLTLKTQDSSERSHAAMPRVSKRERQHS